MNKLNIKEIKELFVKYKENNDIILINKMKNINEEITNILLDLIRLDSEYKENIYTDVMSDWDFFEKFGYIRPRYDIIKNKHWEGYWKNCCGNDAYNFLIFIEEINDNNTNSNAEDLFKQYNPSYNKIPYYIKQVDYILKKYL